MKRVFLPYSNLTIDLIIDTVANTYGTIVSLDPICDGILTEKGINHKKIQDYAVDISQVRKDAWNLINEWSEKTVQNKKNRDYLTLSGFPFLMANKMALYYILIKILKKFNYIYKILNEEKPDEIIIAVSPQYNLLEIDMDFIYPILKIFSKERKIKITVLKKTDKIGAVKHIFLKKTINFLAEYRHWKRKKYSSLNGKPDIVFFHHGMANVADTGKLYHKFARSNVVPAYICSDGIVSDEFVKYLKKKSINYIYTDVYLDSKVRKKVRNYSKINNKLWTLLIKNKEYRNTFRYKNIVIFDVLKPVLLSLFVDKFEENLKRYLSIDNLLKDLKPNLGFLSEDSTIFGRTAAYGLHKNKILSITIEHGPFAGYGETEINSDYVFVWNDIEKKNLIKWGIEPDRIVVTGTDQYTNLLAQYMKFDRLSVLNELGLNKNNKYVIFSCGWPVQKDFIKINQLIKTVSKDKKIILVIKLHPCETFEMEKKVSNLFTSKNIIVMRTVSYYKLLRVADLVISHSVCRTSQDSIAFGVPLILWDIDDKLNEDFPCKLTFDEKIKPFERVIGINALNFDIINKFLFDKTTREKVKKLSMKYTKKNFSSQDMNIITNFVNKKVNVFLDKSLK